MLVEGESEDNGGGEKGFNRNGSDGETVFGGLGGDCGDLEKVRDNNHGMSFSVSFFLSFFPFRACLTSLKHNARGRSTILNFSQLLFSEAESKARNCASALGLTITSFASRYSGNSRFF